jgi:DNA replication protein DnaC
LAACQKGCWVRFTTAASLVQELMEAKEEKRLLRFQKLKASYELPIVDEPGFVPLSKTGDEMLCAIFSLRYERGVTMVTGNLPFNEWTGVLGSERLTGTSGIAKIPPKLSEAFSATVGRPTRRGGMMS